MKRVQPAVSVLIPVYNGAAYVRSAIDSALNQRDVAVEVIVIDDGSTDRTPEVLAEYGDSIRVLRQKNAGHVCSRNNGARIAHGDWLACLDADDEWLPDKLAKQLALADESIGMVYTDRQNFGEIERIADVASEAVPLWEGDLFEPLLFGNFVTVSSVIVRRGWFERLNGFDQELLVCEDWDMWLRFSAANGKAAVCREPLTRYRWHTSSMTFNHHRMCTGRLKVVRRALATVRGGQVSAAIRQKAIAAAWKTSAWYAQPSERLLALGWYMRSSLHWPLDLAVYRGMLKCCLGQS